MWSISPDDCYYNNLTDAHSVSQFTAGTIFQPALNYLPINQIGTYIPNTICSH